MWRMLLKLIFRLLLVCLLYGCTSYLSLSGILQEQEAALAIR